MRHIILSILLIIGVEAGFVQGGQRFYVNATATGTNDGSSWSDAFTSLQSALTAASSSGGSAGEIWVAAGSYKPAASGGSRSASFNLGNGVGVYGGFAGTESARDQRSPTASPTILSGDLNGNDGPDFANISENSYHVVTAVGVTAGTLLDGFTITGGNTSGSSQNSGAGLYITGSSILTVNNCIFRDNSAYNAGAISIPSTSSPTVTHCTFLHNQATGSLNNYPSGGAISTSSSSAVISDCLFLQNQAASRGGAILSSSQALGTGLILNCFFCGNIAPNGGAVFLSGPANAFVNCTFSGNSATAGGAFYARNSTNYTGVLSLINCTFASNSASSSGGGIYAYSSNTALTNCILWGNSGPSTSESGQFTSSGPGTVAVNFCRIMNCSGSWGGLGNSGDDPRLLNPAGADGLVGTADDDLHLMAGSPCIDAGQNAAVPAVVTIDADGQPRFRDDPAVGDTGSGTSPIVDIGAYEGAVTSGLIVGPSVIVPEGGTSDLSVSLGSDPGGTIQVTVAWSGGDADISVQSGVSLTFDSSNYATPQAVRLAAAEDADFLPGSAIISVTAPGMSPVNVVATEADNDPIPSVLFVNAGATGTNSGVSWIDAMRDLQDALTAADLSAGAVHEIWVASGTYRPKFRTNPSLSRSETFRLRNGLALYGGFVGNEVARDARNVAANPTLLSGDLAGNDTTVAGTWSENSYHVITGSGTDASAILDGFVVTGGHANGSGEDGFGGGMYDDNGSPSVANCTFLRNHTTSGYSIPTRGAGVYIGHASSPHLTACLFQENLATGTVEYGASGGGLFNGSGSTPVILDCSFIQNTCLNGDGGAIYNDQSQPEFIGCRFASNSTSGSSSKGGAMCNSGSSTRITNCLFQSNTGPLYGGAIASLNAGNPIVTCCVFTGNTGFYGGALYQSGSAPSLINCTLAGNTATVNGGALFDQAGGNPVLTNCILWGNIYTSSSGSGSQIYDNGGAAVVNYSCIQGGWSGAGGVGNISADPLFMDADGPDNIFGSGDDNVHLAGGSPCVNAGSNAAISGVATDADGNSRISGGVVDLGALEQRLILTPGLVTVPEGATAGFTISLADDPGAPVTITTSFASGDTDISVQSGGSLAFDASNFAVPQMVTLAAAEDPDYTHGTAVVQVSGWGAIPLFVTVREQDNDVPPGVRVKADAAPGGDGSSWGRALRTVEEGIDAVLSSGGSVSEIWVAAGTYRPSRRTTASDPRTATLQLVKGVALYGGFTGTETERGQRNPVANTTILSGDLNGDDGPNFANNGENCYHVVTANNVDATAVLDGFTVRAGNANGTGVDQNKGGGVFSYNGAPALAQCVITENSAQNYGGLWIDNAAAAVTDCSFSGNRASQDGGGAATHYARLTITRCVFANNTAGDEGGGLYVSYSYDLLTFTDCRFENNSARYGGAVVGPATLSRCTFTSNRASENGGAISGGPSQLVNCVFQSNSSGNSAGAANLGSQSMVKGCTFTANRCDTGSGGALSCSIGTVVNSVFSGNQATTYGGAFRGNGMLVNCSFSGNSANDGGAVYTTYSNSTMGIVNCTFSRNIATDRGGGLYSYSTTGWSPIVTNTILWDNLDSQGNNAGSQISSIGGGVTVSYSCVLGGFAGTGNTDQDPRLIDADGADNIAGTADDDLRLRPDSPAIDAGDNTAVPPDTTDLNQDGNTTELTPLDLGGHPRFVDDPQTIDHGRGTAPIVDMGAYEFDFALLNVDTEGDGVLDFQDNCPNTANADQLDTDGDSIGDACDACPLDPRNDQDGDGICGNVDNCPAISNPDQADADGDGEGNACEPTGIVYVRANATGANNGTSWTDAYTNLQSALSATVGSGGSIKEVWVAAGTYKPAGVGGVRTASFQMVNGVSIYGGFAGSESRRDLRNPTANQTILSGDLNGNDTASFTNNGENSYHVVTAASGINSTAVLDGFSITGGNAGTGASSTNGGGLYIDAAGPTVTRCRFVANTSSNGGGGASVMNNGNPSFLGCVFVGNRSASGGGIVFYSSAGKVFNSGFFGNTATATGGGAYMYTVVPSVVTNSLVFTNCIFSGNTGPYSGGISGYDSNFSLVGCTVYGNSSTNLGGGLNLSTLGVASISGCILWGNRDSSGTGTLAQLRTSNNAAATVNYSCVQDGWTGGVGNVASDPLFVKPAGADGVVGTEDDGLDLGVDSPCVDAADTTALPLDVTDLDGDGNTIERIPTDYRGNPRLLDRFDVPNRGAGSPPIMDMGACEQALLAVTPAAVVVPEGGTASFTVALTWRPANPITVSVARVSGDTDISVASGAILTFDATNFDTPQTVTLAAAIDTDYLAGSAVIRIQPQGIVGTDLAAREVDRDSPAVLFVNASAPVGGNGLNWQTAFRSLQDAIDAAQGTAGAVHEIWVAAGTYRPSKRSDSSNSRTATFQLASGLAIYGGFSGTETSRDQRNPGVFTAILSGDLNGNDGANFANNSDNAYHVVTGSGTDATAVLDGFTVTAGNANGTVSQSLGGGLYTSLGSPIIARCGFVSNAATIGGGAYFSGTGRHPLVSNCRILGNSASGGGGGLFMEQSVNASIVNCTFSRNAGGSLGAAFRVAGATASLINSVLWGDTPGNEINLSLGANLTVNYSDVSGGTSGVSNTASTLTWGSGNLSSDPLFVNATNNNVHLGPISPCIDAGDPASDYSLEPEPDGGRINMGAYGNTAEAETRGWLYIDGYAQVRSTRVGRTVFEYDFALNLRNASQQAYTGVVALLQQAPSNVTVIDNRVDVGTVPALGSLASPDTFTIRVDRSTLVSPIPISWQVSFAGGRSTMTALLDLGPAAIVAADFNSDEHVDGNDLAILQACTTGPTIPYAGNVPADCTLKPDADGFLAADFDHDGDVDQDDFAAFQLCFGGSQAPPACK